MTTPNPTPLKVGDLVRIRNSGYLRPGKIVEDRGLLGPGGTRIFRVRVRRKPSPAYTEVREDQLELIPPTEKDTEVEGDNSKLC
jgi:hypothetical protein